MSYEDFIEGIKPKINGDEESELSYEIQSGIFKSICKLAENKSSTYETLGNFEHAWEKLIELVKTNLLEDKLVKIGSWEFGLSSMGSLKYSSLNTPSKYNFTITKQNVYDAYQNKRARPSGAFQKDMVDVVDFMKAQFNLKNHQEKEIVNKETSQNFILIIDEINRGNVSSIFGELITLIEEDKRFGEKEALEVTLPYSKEKFSIPPNLYIIGTMNTADRSVEALDTALRRRFSFVEMMPKPELLRDKGADKSGVIDGIDLVTLLKTINDRIEALVDRDHTIGHSYFMNVETKNDLQNVFKDKVIPLLQEYFFGDYAKMEMVIGSYFFEPKLDKVIFAVQQDSYVDIPKRFLLKDMTQDSFDILQALNELIGIKTEA